jgi:hypothetical protein
MSKGTWPTDSNLRILGGTLGITVPLGLLFNDKMGEAIGAGMAASDAMLFGRVTYEEFAAFWPYQGGDDQEFAY